MSTRTFRTHGIVLGYDRGETFDVDADDTEALATLEPYLAARSVTEEPGDSPDHAPAPEPLPLIPAEVDLTALPDIAALREVADRYSVALTGLRKRADIESAIDTARQARLDAHTATEADDDTDTAGDATSPGDGDEGTSPQP